MPAGAVTGVRVTHQPAGGDPFPAETLHSAGRSVAVKEGHLRVTAGAYDGAPVLAVYAPGQWLRAEVVYAP